MQTNYQTTFILLERGEEDKRIVREIEKLAYTHHQGFTKEFMMQYPMLAEIHHQLKMELDEAGL